MNLSTRLLMLALVLMSLSVALSASARDLGQLGQSAQQGDANVQLELGQRYIDGTGVVANLEKARKLFLSAARQGNPRAPFLLASSYLFADPPDLVNGYSWLLVAKEPGLPDALFAAHLAEESRSGLNDAQLAQAKKLAEHNLKLFQSNPPTSP